MAERWHCFLLFFFLHGNSSIKGIRLFIKARWAPLNLEAACGCGRAELDRSRVASECQVRIKLKTLLRHCGSVLVMTIVMFLAFRFPGGNERLVPSLTNRKVALVSLVLALCLPLPQTEGVPLVALVVMAPISLFRDNGHVGPWALPLIAGTALAVCFTAMFLPTSAVAWLVRRSTPRSSSSG